VKNSYTYTYSIPTNLFTKLNQLIAVSSDVLVRFMRIKYELEKDK